MLTENSPFRLLAITNRLDLHSLDLGSGGEGRFTFGALDPITRAPLTWLFIFEYNLNASSPSDCTNWANTWHSLGNPSLTDSMYLERLVAVTDSFVMMRNLNQLRTNDFHLRRLWELREFGHDLSSNTFIAQPLALTPDLSFNGSEELGQFVEDNVAGIDSCNYEYPDSMKAASTADNNARFTWNIQGSAPDKTKKKASLFTCNGCHNGDKLQIVDTVTPNFLHIPPRDSLNESQVSEFLKTMARLNRREVFLKALQVDSNTIDSIMKMPLTSAEISDRKVFIERLPENFIH